MGACTWGGRTAEVKPHCLACDGWGQKKKQKTLLPLSYIDSFGATIKFIQFPLYYKCSRSAKPRICCFLFPHRIYEADAAARYLCWGEWFWTFAFHSFALKSIAPCNAVHGTLWFIASWLSLTQTFFMWPMRKPFHTLTPCPEAFKRQSLY